MTVDKGQKVADCGRGVSDVAGLHNTSSETTLILKYNKISYRQLGGVP